MGLENFTLFKQNPSKMCLHLTVERNHLFCHICTKNVESTEVSKNITNNYVKKWKHVDINPKGKMPLASIEELESEEIEISSDGNRISNLVREGNDVVDCSMLSITLCLYS